jgi:membrane-bound lytic murein transglycosylase A
MEGLIQAVEQEIQYLEKNPSSHEFVFGHERISKTEYLKGMRRFSELAKNSEKFDEFFEKVRDEFDFYEVYGQSRWGQVFITSYFEPVIQGSLKKTEKFSVPLYRAPDDLITVDLSLFDPKVEGTRKIRGRIKDRMLIPYYPREDIDHRQALQGKKLEICWVDPVDAFFLQIQGSGTVDLGHGKVLHLHYADQNGLVYEPVGKYLREVIPPDQMNMHTIEAHLRKLPREEMQKYLNKNPSYVFFRTAEQNAITYLGVPATAGRTIATDRRYFPKGALAILSFEKPVFSTPNDTSPASFEKVNRFVLDQDVGGAINGGGRVDLFWGQGDLSKRYAGVMQGSGSLYYLAPKRLQK